MSTLAATALGLAWAAVIAHGVRHRAHARRLHALVASSGRSPGAGGHGSPATGADRELTLPAGAGLGRPRPPSGTAHPGRDDPAALPLSAAEAHMRHPWGDDDPGDRWAERTAPTRRPAPATPHRGPSPGDPAGARRHPSATHLHGRPGDEATGRPAAPLDHPSEWPGSGHGGRWPMHGDADARTNGSGRPAEPVQPTGDGRHLAWRTGDRPRLGRRAGDAHAGRPSLEHAQAAASGPAVGARAAGTAAAAIGRLLRRAGRRPPDPEADRRVGLATIAAIALYAVAAPLAVLPAGWAVGAPLLAERRRARAHEAAAVDQLPDVTDLLILTTTAGLPVSASVEAIGGMPGGPFGAGLAQATAHVRLGGATADALGCLVDAAGPVARPLVDALADHDRYGTPLRPTLERVAVEARMRRRRRAEEDARRLPVTLLFPLVLTTLPAFFLLAIVPLLVGSLGAISP